MAPHFSIPRRHPPPATAVQELTGKFDGISISGDRPAGEDKGDMKSELEKMKLVRRKKDFEVFERFRGRMVNIVQGLELHTNVFSPAEQKEIITCVYDLQKRGRRGELRERTYLQPKRSMRGKGRCTMQFGCCYNYATDNKGNPPGIIRNEDVDPIPPLLKSMIKRMVAWKVLPPTCIPNSCIVNIYDVDDCIPPHIDHHDFLRPFCTVSFLSECKIVFGTQIEILGPGEFSGSLAVPLPIGSVLVLNGNGADVAKHCVPAVPTKRISITFRKMDESKIPYNFQLDPEMQNLQPLDLGNSPSYQVHNAASHVQQQARQASSSQVPLPRTNGSFQGRRDTLEVIDENPRSPFRLSEQDFPAVGSSFSGQCNLFQPLKLGKSSSQALPVKQQGDTASASQVNLSNTNKSFQSQKDTPEVACEKPRSPFLDHFKPGLGRSSCQQVGVAASPVQQKGYHASSSRFQSQKDTPEVAREKPRSPFLDHFKPGLGRSSCQQVGVAASPVQQNGYHASSSRFQSQKDSPGVTHTKSEILFQLNDPDFPSLGSSYPSSDSGRRLSRLT